MNENEKYEEEKKKLHTLCAENHFSYTLGFDEYPATLIIRPDETAAAQLSFAPAGEREETGADAFLKLSIIDGAVTYKFSDTFIISDELLSKCKRLFSKMYLFWVQYLFREIMQRHLLDSAAMTTLIGKAVAGDRPEGDAPKDYI